MKICKQSKEKIVFNPFTFLVSSFSRKIFNHNIATKTRNQVFNFDNAMKKYFTEKKLEEFKKELKRLKTVERPKIIERVRIAVSFGDLSENSEYQNAKEEQGFLEGRILELEEIIKQAEIVTKKEDIDYIRIGSFVILENVNNQKREKFEIVGIGESDPLKGKISYESPLGIALLKKQKGDIVEITISKKKIIYKIIEIR